MSKFQTIFIGVLVLIILGAVLVFSFSKSNTSTTHPLTLWGTVDDTTFNNFIQQIREKTAKQFEITYVEKSPAKFEQDFIEALASGGGPDLVLLPHDLILKHKDKLLQIPFKSYPERTFKDTFLDEGELFLTSTSVIGLPFSINPLVMYFNPDMLSAASISSAPRFWDEFPNLVEKITKKDNALNISKSAIALGEFSNVYHAKEILSALLMQAGNPIVTMSEGKPLAVIGEQFNYTIPPAEAAVNFFSQFSNPAEPLYSWNRSRVLSRDAFTSEDLAVYFGFASELPFLRQKNPNLNFDVITLPQARGSDKRITYGALQALAIVRTTKYSADALHTIIDLTSAQNNAIWSSSANLPPVRRDLLAGKPSSAAGSVFYTSALWSRGWLDPNPAETQKIFQTMIDSISSGRALTSEAVARAQQELGLLIK